MAERSTLWWVVTICGGVIALAGLLLVGLYAGWWTALGLFLAMYGNNMQRSAKL